MHELTSEQVKQVSGGLISAETVGCALGGALGASLGVWGGAFGCMLGGAAANSIASGGAAGYWGTHRVMFTPF